MFGQAMILFLFPFSQEGAQGLCLAHLLLFRLRCIFPAKKYGTYRLMLNYGDNFREGSAYENNAESLFEVQFLDYGAQGTDDEWTPVNTSPNATQGSAVESNFAPGATADGRHLGFALALPAF